VKLRDVILRETTADPQIVQERTHLWLLGSALFQKEKAEERAVCCAT